MAAKLVFYYGTVNSSKTMQLLAIAHNYSECGWNVCTIKPSLDTRSDLIETRAHLPSRKADILLSANESILNYNEIINNADVILIDECQFLTVSQVDELRNLTISRDIDILCFGLRTDFTVHLFPASKRLFELADELSEIKTICSVCGKHASFNDKVCHCAEDNNSNIIPSWNAFEQRCWKHFNYRD